MNDVTIFVEGEADKKFIEDFVRYLCNNHGIVVAIDLKDRVLSTGGWTVLNAEEKGQLLRNKMMETTKRGGKNLVIFDADTNAGIRAQELHAYADKYHLVFDTFLFPNNQNPGALEELLEQLINPQNQCILTCWHDYETQLSQQIIPWKTPKQPTTPSSKSKIYGYLEALVGTSRADKDSIKDRNRDFLNPEHWNLNAAGGIALTQFLMKYL